MTIKFHPIILGILLLGVLLFLFLLFRGCSHAKAKIAEASVLKEMVDSLVKKQVFDSIQAKTNLDNYDASLEYANGIIALRENKIDATEAKLLATTFERNDYKKKYESVKPDLDTSVTLVPNDFIQDAHQCFDKSEYQDRLIKLYVKENHELDSSNKIKEQLHEKRIRQLGQERDAVSLTLTDCLTAAKRQQALQPRSKILLSIGAIWAPLPKAIGGGLIFQDKRGRQLGAKVYGSNWGTLYESELNLPLSFKRR